MSLSESTKQRALRIDLDHHKRPEPLARLKWLLAIVAAVLSVMYAAWLYLPGSEAKAQLSPGHVSQVHAAFNNRCTECHQDFHAIRGDAWALSKGEFDPHGGAWASDAKCVVCHAAPAHHTNLKDVQQVESCGGCHQDHQGFNALLTRIDDQHCTRCHSGISSVVDKSIFSEPASPDVHSFTKGHPKFRSLASGDPGKIEFNHALHMRPGLTKTGDGRVLSKYEDLDSQYLQHAIPEWEASKTKSGAVQLQCASCHEATPSDDRQAFSAGGETAVRNTAHMAPVQFDRHCQACHALKIGPEENAVVPHGLKASELKQAVLASLTDEEETPASKSSTEEYRKLLGKSRADLDAAKLADKPDRRLKDIRAHLATTCTKCHSYADGQNPFTGDVLPAAIPQFWFQHGRFDHSAHRAMDCLHCHGDATHATKREAVMIPNYDTCVECHSPAGQATPTSAIALKFAGARSDCVECHNYHGASLKSQPRLRAAP